MWTSAELKMRAKGAFQKNYWSAVLVGFVMAILAEVPEWQREEHRDTAMRMRSINITGAAEILSPLRQQ